MNNTLSLRKINIPELNTLRFIFMTVIFFHHMNNCTMFPPGGYLAVSFFFVLSGFSMTIGYRDKISQPDFSYLGFITKRLTKFYPIHWLVLFTFLILNFNTLIQQDFFCAKFTTNFFLLQSFIPLKDFYFSFNSPSWYLCNTLFYCLLFPFILRFICNGSQNRKLITIITLVILYVMLVIIVPKQYHHAILYVNPFVRIVDFVVGIYTGLFFLDHCVQVNEKKEENRKVWWYFFAIVCFAAVVYFSFSNIDSDVKSYIVRFYWLIFSPMILIISIISVRRNGLNGMGGG